MSTALLEDLRVTSGDLWIPYTGLWHASVALDVESALTGAVSFTIADLTLAGTVVSGGSYRGASRYWLVAGAGGWRKRVGPLGYSLPAGVRLSLVLADLARATGETVKLGTDRVLGPAFTRAAGAASAVLGVLGDPWYVDAAGVTQVASRPTGTVTGRGFEVLSVDAARGVAELGSEAIAALEPGKTIDVGLAAPIVIGTTHHRLGSGSLRSEVWAA